MATEKAKISTCMLLLVGYQLYFVILNCSLSFTLKPVIQGQAQVTVQLILGNSNEREMHEFRFLS